MNLTPSRAAEYCAALRPLVEDLADRTLFVLPPFPAIAAGREALAGSNVAWGAQDVHPDDEGAHTGDVSASMLADLGCTFVEVGHHERRRDHHEDDDLVAAKVAAIQRWGMTAILCVGEANRTNPEAARAHVLGQLRFVDRFDTARLVVAYEPAWAIGVGAERAPSAWIGSMHEAIRQRLAVAAGSGTAIPVIYGGSVDAAGTVEILGTPGVDGLFVGRYALTPEGFAEIAHMNAIRLTERQAYEAFIEYLRAWPRETDALNLRDVGSGIDPTVWADGSPADPAVPWDWANAASTVTNVAAARPVEDDYDLAFPEREWLKVLHAFVLSLWPLLGDLPLNPLIAILEQKDSALPGSDVSPWQLWTQATGALLRETH